MSASLSPEQALNQNVAMSQIRGLLFGATEHELQQQITQLSNALQRETEQMQHEWQNRLQLLESRLSLLSQELHAADHQTTQTLSQRANTAEQRLQQLEMQFETHLLDLQNQLQHEEGKDTQTAAPKTPLGLAQAENQRVQIELRADIEQLRQDMTQSLQQMKQQLKTFFQELLRRQHQQYAALKTEMTQELQRLQEEKVNRDDLAQLFGRMVSRLSGEMNLSKAQENDRE
jgi:hypothetical protein